MVVIKWAKSVQESEFCVLLFSVEKDVDFILVPKKLPMVRHRKMASDYALSNKVWFYFLSIVGDRIVSQLMI